MEKKAKAKRSRTKKEKFRKGIGTLIFAMMVTIIALSALYHSELQGVQAVDKYFKFTDAAAEATPVDPSNSSILVKQLWFNITAVQGDAKDVLILPPGMVNREDAPQYPEIIQGQSEVVYIMFQHPVISSKQNNIYPISMQVICSEPTLAGRVTINITEFYHFQA